MKVIHIISGGDSGGAKTHLISLAKELSKHIDMKIVCFLEGDFYIEAKKLNLPVVLIKQKRRTDTFFNKDLMKFIDEEKPDIIHCHGARANFSVFLKKNKIKCPTITTVHSDYKLDFKDNLYKHIVYTALNKISLGTFNYYIGVSPEFKNMLVERGYKEDKIYSIFNGVDFEEELNILDKKEFENKYNFHVDENKIVVGNLSRLELVKGVDVFLEGAKLSLMENPNLHFLIAGDGTQKENLINKAKELGMEENITFMGFIRDVASFLNYIDINVISSHSESFTYSLLEGARQKKASVASNVGGLPYMIKDYKTGLLFDDNDTVKLKENILKYAEDKKFRNEMGEAFYEYAKDNFSTKAMCNRHLEIYNEVIKRGK